MKICVLEEYWKKVLSIFVIQWCGLVIIKIDANPATFFVTNTNMKKMNYLALWLRTQYMQHYYKKYFSWFWKGKTYCRDIVVKYMVLIYYSCDKIDVVTKIANQCIFLRNHCAMKQSVKQSFNMNNIWSICLGQENTSKKVKFVF